MNFSTHSTYRILLPGATANQQHEQCLRQRIKNTGSKPHSAAVYRSSMPKQIHGAAVKDCGAMEKNCSFLYLFQKHMTRAQPSKFVTVPMKTGRFVALSIIAYRNGRSSVTVFSINAAPSIISAVTAPAFVPSSSTEI